MKRVHNDWKQSYRRELEHWPGVTYKFEGGSKHPRIVLSFGLKSKWQTLASTASDHRSIKNSISQIRNLLEELGAHRVEATPKSKRERQMQEEHMTERGGVARLGINDVSVSFVIPKGSPIYGRFADKQHKAVATWTFELRANPDPKGDPWFVVKKVEGDYKGKLAGAGRGSYVKVNGAFNIAISRSKLPAFEKFGAFRTAPLELTDMADDIFVFKMPKDRQPTIMRGKKKVEFEQAVEREAEPYTHAAPPVPEQPSLPEPVESVPVGQIDFHALVEMLATTKQPKSPEKMTLQFPERPLTVERCINFLNARVQSRGKNLLRIMLNQETGLLSYIEKGGPAY